MTDTPQASDIEAAMEDLLQYFPPGVKVDVNFTPDGAITFTVQATKEQLIKEKYGNLLGQPITLTEAAEKYGVNRATISAWHYRSNYISPIDETVYPALFDEAEIAYLVNIYQQRRAQHSKAPLLDENGLPYQIQHPKLAEYRRRRRDT